MRRLLVTALALLVVPGASARTQGGAMYAYVSLEHANVLAIVYPELGQVRDEIPVPRGPHNVASTGSRSPIRIAVTSPPAGAVTLLELFRRNVTVLRGFASPHDVEFSPDGRWAYVTEERGARIAVLSATRRRLVRRVAVAPGPHDLAVSPDGRRVWVTHGSGATRLTILDTSRPARTRVLRRLPSGYRAPHDITFAPTGTVWVTYWNSGYSGRYDSRTGKLDALVGFAELPHHVAASKDHVWVTDHRGSRAILLGPRGRLLAKVPTGPDPHHVSLLLGRAVVVGSDGTVSTFDAATGKRRYSDVRLRRNAHGVALVWGP